jgi:hypothetical protein
MGLADSLRGSNSHAPEAENDDATYSPLMGVHFQHF